MFYYIRGTEKVDTTDNDDHIDHELGLRDIAQQIVKTVSRWIGELGGTQRNHRTSGTGSQPLLIEHFAILDLLPPIFSSAIQDEGRVPTSVAEKQSATEWVTGLLDILVGETL